MNKTFPTLVGVTPMNEKNDDEFSYNVLDEPWMPVIDLEGRDKELGVKDLVIHAHDIKCISDPMPLFEFGMYRFLQAFVMDAFAIHDQDDVERLLDHGSFDKDVISKYADRWHDRFDLFDAKHPFYQVPIMITKKNVKPVAMLLSHVASGNNTIHFTMRFQTHHAFSPKICARALTIIPPFTFVYGGGKYTNGVNHKPPWYILIDRSNLFETLVLNTCFTDIPLNNGSGTVPWKMTTHSKPQDEIRSISTLQGMTFLSRFVHLIPEQGETCTYTGDPSGMVVREIVYDQGLQFPDNERKSGVAMWIDPNVSYEMTKKGERAVIPRSRKKIWRNVGALMTIPRAGIEKTWYERPKVVSQLVMLRHDEVILPTDEFLITAYGLQNDQAKLLEWQREHLGIPMRILMSGIKGQYVQDALSFIDVVNDKVMRAIRKAFGDEKKKIKDLAQFLFEHVARSFQDVLEPAFRNEYLKHVSDANDDHDELGEVLDTWKERVKISARRVLRDELDPFTTSVDIIERHVKSEIELNKQLKWLEKKKKKVIA